MHSYMYLGEAVSAHQLEQSTASCPWLHFFPQLSESLNEQSHKNDQLSPATDSKEDHTPQTKHQCILTCI
jgi:hypothetical protein